MLELDGVQRVFRDGHPIHALRETNLGVAQGDYVTITGASGSGKSTLLNVLGLLDTPTSGSYKVLGHETTDMDEKWRGALRGQLFGFVFQAFHLLPGRSALENVELGMIYGAVHRKRRRDLAMTALDRMGLSARAASDPRTMSGGERQRVAIARAIAGGPSVLFCDEPTGSLDSANTGVVLDVLEGIHQEGMTVVVVTHDPVVAGRGLRRFEVLDGRVSESLTNIQR
ncbi:ABC transporter ATP-binding protein [Micromonospora sp. NPDC005367]|uniref:ABC transporter ATP-binding protein n=1 Tax=Micromonospora sp. NPDC005367 TaxID=3155590 RepID=UPI0033AE38E7